MRRVGLPRRDSPRIEPLTGRGTDAASGAGDKCDLSVEPFEH